MNFVEDDQAIFQIVEKQPGLGKTSSIIGVLEVEVQPATRLPDLQCESSLANLARTDQQHGGLAPKSTLDITRDEAVRSSL